ncbi:MAG: ankyrin repeat domain-containing protein, partial [Myxococcota bacterium]
AAAEGHIDVVDFLLSRGASADVVDRWGGTPLDDARLGSHAAVIEKLEAIGAAEGKARHPEGTSGTQPGPVSSHQADPVDVVELLWAASEGLLGSMMRLFARGVPAFGTDYDGRTALHLAASEGQVNATRYLLAQGHPLHVYDRWGASPLDEARNGDHAEVVELLEAHAATLDASRSAAS